MTLNEETRAKLVTFLQFNDSYPDGIYIDGDKTEKKNINELRENYFLLIAEWTQAKLHQCNDEASVMSMIDLAAIDALEAAKMQAETSFHQPLDEVLPHDARQELVQILKNEVHSFFARRNHMRHWQDDSDRPRLPPMP